MTRVPKRFLSIKWVNKYDFGVLNSKSPARINRINKMHYDTICRRIFSYWPKRKEPRMRRLIKQEIHIAKQFRIKVFSEPAKWRRFPAKKAQQ